MVKDLREEKVRTAAKMERERVNFLREIESLNKKSSAGTVDSDREIEEDGLVVAAKRALQKQRERGKLGLFRASILYEFVLMQLLAVGIDDFKGLRWSARMIRFCTSIYVYGHARVWCLLRGPGQPRSKEHIQYSPYYHNLVLPASSTLRTTFPPINQFKGLTDAVVKMVVDSMREQGLCRDAIAAFDSVHVWQGLVVNRRTKTVLGLVEGEKTFEEIEKLDWTTLKDEDLANQAWVVVVNTLDGHSFPLYYLFHRGESKEMLVREVKDVRT